jgi:hypothetical protein
VKMGLDFGPVNLYMIECSTQGLVNSGAFFMFMGRARKTIHTLC